jgi:hypothetical protein
MYQRAWENEIREVAVHVIDVEDCEPKSTKVTGTRGPYYRRVRPKGEQSDDIEKSLSVLEGKAATPLRQLIAGQPLEPERKGIVAQLLAGQIVRGPAFFEQREELIRPTFEAAEAKDFRPQGLASVDGDLNVARQKAIDAELNPTTQLVTMLAYARKIASVLGLMRWQLLRFDEPLLAYSDHPVVLWPLNLESSLPFKRQGLGPLETQEIRVPIAPDVAILMNWLDLNDVAEVRLPASAAGELNAFTISQAEREWMHKLGREPVVAEGIFRPLSRLIDVAYDRLAALRSARHQLAAQFVKQVRGRQFVNDVDVLVEIENSI